MGSPSWMTCARNTMRPQAVRQWPERLALTLSKGRQVWIITHLKNDNGCLIFSSVYPDLQQKYDDLKGKYDAQLASLKGTTLEKVQSKRNGGSCFLLIITTTFSLTCFLSYFQVPTIEQKTKKILEAEAAVVREGPLQYRVGVCPLWLVLLDLFLISTNIFITDFGWSWWQEAEGKRLERFLDCAQQSIHWVLSW